MQAELMNAIISALGTILVALIGFVAQKVAQYLKEKGITEQLEKKEYLVSWAVQGIEQIYQNESGPEKFEKAKSEVVKLFKENGVQINSDELDILIEAMVKSMNDGFNSVKEKDEIPTYLEKGVDK